eukprot:jgi/Antlo1/2076/2095
MRLRFVSTTTVLLTTKYLRYPTSMKKYIANLANINQNHADQSDYDRFYDHCKQFILSSSTDANEIYDSVYSALMVFFNNHLVSMAFRLLAQIHTDRNVEVSVIQKHLDNREVVNAVFEYLLVIKDREPFRKSIIEHLYDPEYESTSFFKLISLPEYECDLARFICLEAPESLVKRLKTMINTRRFYDISRYVAYFGDNDSYICFLVYELFVIYFQDTESVCGSMGNMEIAKCEENTIISFKSKICVENPNNFLFYFFDFMAESKTVLEKIGRSDLCGVQEVLSKYLTSTYSLKINTRMRCLKEYNGGDRVPQWQDSTPESSNECFDYLFGGACYRTICDCTEL